MSERSEAGASQEGEGVSQLTFKVWLWVAPQRAAQGKRRVRPCWRRQQAECSGSIALQRCCRKVLLVPFTRR